MEPKNKNRILVYWIDLIKYSIIKMDEIKGINRIIFQYCHFPFPFENELLDKTQCIYKKLNRMKYLYFCVYVNDNKNWVIRGSGFMTPKYDILLSLKYRENKYREIIGLKPSKLWSEPFTDLI